MKVLFFHLQPYSTTLSYFNNHVLNLSIRMRGYHLSDFDRGMVIGDR